MEHQIGKNMTKEMKAELMCGLYRDCTAGARVVEVFYTAHTKGGYRGGVWVIVQAPASEFEAWDQACTGRC